MRDLDDLLDPVVSRRASEAAHTPDFATVERRGRKRQRRARVTAVGAVVAVVAAGSVVGTQVASDRSDTAPANPPGFDDSDGRLARAVGSGDAYPGGVAMSDTGATLATWKTLVMSRDGDPIRSGFALAVDGDTYWSPMRYGEVSAAPLTSNTFVVGVSTVLGKPLTYSLVDESGVHPLEIAPRADLADGSTDGFAVLSDRWQPAVYAVDVETRTASPVSELAKVTPLAPDPTEVLQTEDGELWVIDLAPNGPRLVHLASDGEVSSYPLPPGGVRDDVTMNLRAFSVSPDGRPILLWIDGRPGGEGGLEPPLTLRLTTVVDSTVRTYDYLGGYRDRTDPSAATLPDGRLLINTGESLLRTSDPDWRRATEVDLSSVARRRDLRALSLRSTDETTCLAQRNGFTVRGMSLSEILCTTDGDSWEQVDLTP